MKYIIEYWDIGEGGGLAMFFPEFTRKEIIESDTEEELNTYILKQKDKWGGEFRKKKSFGFDYISNNGAVKVKQYKEPKIKKI